MIRKFHNLRVRFAEMDMKQSDVAKAAGLAPSTMTSRMQGKQPFTTREISALCKVLEIKPDEIGRYFFEDEPRQTVERR